MTQSIHSHSLLQFYDFDKDLQEQLQEFISSQPGFQHIREHLQEKLQAIAVRVELFECLYD